MATNLQNEGAGKQRIISPLSIILAFFSFTEVVLGVGVISTTGLIQVALTVFVISFPIVVAALFFLFLWYRPENFYAPGDFRADKYYLLNRQAARETRTELKEFGPTIAYTVKETLTSEEMINQFIEESSQDVSSKSKWRDFLSNTADTILDKIAEEDFVTISYTSLSGKTDDRLTFPIEAFADFDALVSSVWFNKPDLIKQDTYGTQWILRDKASGAVFKHEMPMQKPPGYYYPDQRTLKEVGIHPGMTLEVIPFE